MTLLEQALRLPGRYSKRRWRMADIARRIVVRVPSKNMGLDESLLVVKKILGRGGCGTCFSGIDINFINEVELSVHPETGAVTATGEKAL